MARNGKIARLPREFREELNRRLAENEPGAVLLKWLNELPAMRALLEREYGGKAVSKQNLCQWRAGGFAEWQARREILGSLDELTAEAEELTEATDGKLTAHLATVLAGRYAAAVAGWNGEVDETLRFKLKVLHGLCRDVAALRQGEGRRGLRIEDGGSQGGAGAVKVGQTNSECGTRSAEGPKCQKMGTEEVRSLNPKAEEPKSERNPKSEGRIVGGTKGGTKTEDDDEEAPKAWTG